MVLKARFRFFLRFDILIPILELNYFDFISNIIHSKDLNLDVISQGFINKQLYMPTIFYLVLRALTMFFPFS